MIGPLRDEGGRLLYAVYVNALGTLATMLKVLLVIASVCMLVGCSSGVNASSTKADISKVADVKSSFGSDFKVKDTPKRAIDPKFFSAHKLPPGLTFDPAECAKVAVGPEMPLGLQGTMAAVSAEGAGNRFVVIAMETSQPLPSNDPGQRCSKVTFSGPKVEGSIEVVDAPHIDGIPTVGLHRALRATNGSGRSAELYHYSAQFGDYGVIVTANPTMNPKEPAAPVDTQRARDLLVKAVNAVRS